MSYGAYAGYQFNEWFSIEGGYLDLNIDSGYEVALKADIEFLNNFDIFGRIGYSSFSNLFGIGTQYNPSENLGIRLEANWYDEVKYQIDPVPVLSLGMQYKFGSYDKPTIIVKPEPIVPNPTIDIVDTTPVHVEHTPPKFDPIHFGFDSLELTDAETVTNIAEVMKKSTDLNVQITAHTDSSGTPEYNEYLSQKRAQAVANMLVELGVDESRIDIIALGDQDPVASNATQQGRAENRRVELKLYR
ncbi:OmpA family protein [Vibrio campbellii]|uniref:OmpA family protein n=1 Tax=Vibrio campbellii TaxID=680 RepID=UPI000CD32EC7|nr:OmpA family protein [Vibrio campbellii]AUW07411.1 hypothetical protein C1N51_27540 [Vibrio campbellii]